jgi:hypothetical protein
MSTPIAGIAVQAARSLTDSRYPTHRSSPIRRLSEQTRRASAAGYLHETGRRGDGNATASGQLDPAAVRMDDAAVRLDRASTLSNRTMPRRFQSCRCAAAMSATRSASPSHTSRSSTSDPVSMTRGML